MAYIWPIALAIVANIVYHMCSKSMPNSVDPFASLTITYIVGAVVSGVLYFCLNKGGDLFKEYSKLNWAPIVLGVVIVGLEAGFIYAYKAGWPVSTAAIVQSAFLAVALLVVGLLAYHEAITWTKVIGVVICLIGLVFINK